MRDGCSSGFGIGFFLGLVWSAYRYPAAFGCMIVLAFVAALFVILFLVAFVTQNFVLTLELVAIFILVRYIRLKYL